MSLHRPLGQLGVSRCIKGARARQARDPLFSWCLLDGHEGRKKKERRREEGRLLEMDLGERRASLRGRGSQGAGPTT